MFLFSVCIVTTLGAPQALLVVYCPDGDHLRVDHRPDLAPQVGFKFI